MLKNNLSKEEIIAYIDKFPDLLESLIGNLSETELKKSNPSPESEWVIDGQWSIAQVIHHIADSHMNKFFQIRHMLTDSNPDLIEYQEKIFSSFADGKVADIESSLSILRGIHQRVVALLRSLDDKNWQNTGVHPKGYTTVEGIAETFISHGETHLDQLKEVLGAN